MVTAHDADLPRCGGFVQVWGICPGVGDLPRCGGFVQVWGICPGVGDLPRDSH